MATNKQKHLDLKKFLLLHKIFTEYKTWTKEKHKAVKELRSFLEEQITLVTIHSNRDSPTTRVHFTHEFTIFKVKEKQQGSLKIFRGCNVLMMCTFREKFNHHLVVFPIENSDQEIEDVVKIENLNEYPFYKNLISL